MLKLCYKLCLIDQTMDNNIAWKCKKVNKGHFSQLQQIVSHVQKIVCIWCDFAVTLRYHSEEGLTLPVPGTRGTNKDLFTILKWSQNMVIKKWFGWVCGLLHWQWQHQDQPDKNPGDDIPIFLERWNVKTCLIIQHIWGAKHIEPNCSCHGTW